MTRLCKKCGTYPRQLVADKSAPSVQTGKFMFTYPMYEEDNCYFCTKQSKKLFDLPSDFFHRGNFVNSHNDGKNKLQA
jgi:hypothetical protein